MIGRRIAACLVLLAPATPLPVSASSVEEDQISARELAEELRLNTRKIILTFDAPVYARADFVRIDAGQAVHNPLTTSQPQVKIPFSYILRNIDMNTESVSLRIGDSATRNEFKRAFIASARVHDIYPKITLPSMPSAETPIYVFLHWDPIKDTSSNPQMTPDQIASKITQGYYLALSFSDKPFEKH